MKLEWWKHKMSCGTERFRLCDGDEETPFFVDKAHYHAHRSWPGMPISLHGAGMGELTSAGYRIAATFGGYSKIKDAKAEGEKMYKEIRKEAKTCET